jgi:sulfide:quinone oxidoreductase
MNAPPRVVIAGGGVAALETALALRALAGDRVATTIISAQDDFVVRPLLVGEPFAKGRAPRVPLKEFAFDVGCELVRGTVQRVDPAARQAHLDDGDPITYDTLVIAIGATPVATFSRALTFTMEADPDESYGGFLRDLEEHYAHRAAFVAPPGVAWAVPIYELALMTALDVHGMNVDDAELHLVTPEDRPLGLFGPAAADDVTRLLKRNRIKLHTSASAEQADDGALLLRPSGEWLERMRVVALPRLKGPDLDGLPQDRDGFIPVDQHGRVRDTEHVFAAGDATTWPVKQGGLATQQADVIAAVIASDAGADVDVLPYRPVLRGVLLTGVEDHYLRSTVGGVGLASDRLMWWPPSKIAGKYLAPYLAGETGETLMDLPTHENRIPIDVELDRSEAFG